MILPLNRQINLEDLAPMLGEFIVIEDTDWEGILIRKSSSKEVHLNYLQELLSNPDCSYSFVNGKYGIILEISPKGLVENKFLEVRYPNENEYYYFCNTDLPDGYKIEKFEHRFYRKSLYGNSYDEPQLITLPDVFSNTNPWVRTSPSGEISRNSQSEPQRGEISIISLNRMGYYLSDTYPITIFKNEDDVYLQVNKDEETAINMFTYTMTCSMIKWAQVEFLKNRLYVQLDVGEYSVFGINKYLIQKYPEISTSPIGENKQSENERSENERSENERSEDEQSENERSEDEQSENERSEDEQSDPRNSSQTSSLGIFNRDEWFKILNSKI
jgi:hypothetical protein